MPQLNRRSVLKKSVIGASIVSLSGLGQANHEDSGVVDFDELSPGAKRVFQQLRTSGPMHGATDVEADTVHPFFLNDKVRYQGELYDVSASRKLAPREVLVNVVPDEKASPQDNAVTSHANLDREARRAFEAVLSGRTSTVSYPVDDSPLPGDAATGMDVRVSYQGDVFQLETVHGDDWVYYLSVSTQ